MAKIKDLTGQKFGKLTVIKDSLERKNRQVKWECLCDCGNTTFVVGQALRNGHIQSCGCNKKNKHFYDLTGQIFGELTVLHRDDTQQFKDRHIRWLCQCTCGNTITVSGPRLRDGKVTKCKKCNGLLEESNLGIKDYSNKRFGKLIALAPTDKRVSGKVIWKCQCDCGNICEVSSNALISGTTQSCGCLKLHSVGEFNIETLLKANNIIFQKQVKIDGAKNINVLRYDFGIFDSSNNLMRLIEFDGEQHFQPINFFGGENEFLNTINKDNIKNEAAKKLNIPLVRIPYTIRNNITLQDLLGDEYLVNI